MIPFLEIVIALIKFATVMAEGQTVEQRKVIWDWVIKDITWWRNALGIDKGNVTQTNNLPNPK